MAPLFSLISGSWEDIFLYRVFLTTLHCCRFRLSSLQMYVLASTKWKWPHSTYLPIFNGVKESQGWKFPVGACWWVPYLCIVELPVLHFFIYIYIYTYTHTHIYTYIHTYIHTYLLLISMLWHRQAIFESKGDKLSSSAECKIRTQRVSETQSSTDWMPADKPTELSRIKQKTWTRQPVPMISKHSAHLTPLPFGIRTWLWRYTYLLLLISMLWHRQAIFGSKGDKLSSSAECRIQTQTVAKK